MQTGIKRFRSALLLGSGLLAAAAAALLPRIPQDPAYHQFADQRSLCGIPHFFDVVSNLPISLAGGFGLWLIFRWSLPQFLGNYEPRKIHLIYTGFFAAVVLTGAGSSYYHLAPDTGRLFWDRLPLSLIFMCLLAAVVGERTGAKQGLRILPFLLMAGAGSVVYWRLSELAGLGDLRPYGLVQFYPPLLMILMVVLYPTRYIRGKYYFGLLLIYALAKAAELLDRQILYLGHLVSGHTIKHLLSAGAIVWVSYYLNSNLLLQAGKDERFRSVSKKKA